MRGIKYFSIDVKANSLITEQERADLELHPKCDELAFWTDLAEKHGVSKSTITVVIPFHNSPHLPQTLFSVLHSVLPGEMKLDVTIVCSACEKYFIALAKNLEKEYCTAKINIKVIVQPNPGKPLALNTFLKINSADLIIQLVDDIEIEKHALLFSYLAMQLAPQYGACVVVGVPKDIVKIEAVNQSFYDEVKEMYYQKFLINQEYSLMGRMFAFRRAILPSYFPEHIMSEDYWLELQSRENSQGFLVLNNTYLLYTNPLNWEDFFRQLDRFYGSFAQLRLEFAESFQTYFGDTKNSWGFMLSDSLDKRPLALALCNFFLKDKHSLISKLLYLYVVFYNLHIVPIKARLKPLKGATFKRELSTYS